MNKILFSFVGYFALVRTVQHLIYVAVIVAVTPLIYISCVDACGGQGVDENVIILCGVVHL